MGQDQPNGGQGRAANLFTPAAQRGPRSPICTHTRPGGGERGRGGGGGGHATRRHQWSTGCSLARRPQAPETVIYLIQGKSMFGHVSLGSGCCSRCFVVLCFDFTHKSEICARCSHTHTHTHTLQYTHKYTLHHHRHTVTGTISVCLSVSVCVPLSLSLSHTHTHTHTNLDLNLCCRLITRACVCVCAFLFFSHYF